MGLVPFKTQPKNDRKGPEQTSTRPLVYSYRVPAVTDDVFSQSHPAQNVVSEAPYQKEDAPADISLEERIENEKIMDLISFLRCDTPSTRDIGPFLKDDTERRAAALEICELIPFRSHFTLFQPHFTLF